MTNRENSGHARAPQIISLAHERANVLPTGGRSTKGKRKVCPMMTRFAAIALALLITSVVDAAEKGGGALSISIKSETGMLEISRGAQKLLTYACATNQFKPYVKELFTLAGDNVLRDAPADHLHHHGLMYAIRVNGTNFWEEKTEPGHERPVELQTREVGANHATFSQLIHWIAHKDKDAKDSAAAALLVERRTITLSVDDAEQEVAVRWQAEFEPGRAAPKAMLTGSHYNGIGLRLPESFNLVAHRFDSADSTFPTNGTFAVTPASWAAMNGKIAGRDTTVALFDKSSNRQGGKMFTMLKIFAYMSATQGLDKAPLEYAAGEKFSLDYLVTAYPAVKSPEFLKKRHAQWER